MRPSDRRHLALAPEPGTSDAIAVKPVLLLREAGLAHTFDNLHARLDAALETGPRVVVVDMSAIGQVSSTTIAALLWVKRRCSARGVEVLLRGSSRRSLDTLRRVGLLGLLDVEGVPSRSTQLNPTPAFREVRR
ncbi:STAS domain-containing protein [Nocardioides islandensis]|nr:STAS domain-containing protein [Nocardioides islandensis]